eukprot:s3840_g4.t1
MTDDKVSAPYHVPMFLASCPWLPPARWARRLTASRCRCSCRKSYDRTARHYSSLPLWPAQATPTLQMVTSADDPRVVIYRHKARRNHPEYQRQVRALAEKALNLEAGAATRRLKELDCQARVHYSWDCLRRLLQARSAGRSVEVHSVLLASDADDSLRSLAARCGAPLFVAEPELIQAEFASEGTTQKRSVNYVVAYPLPRPLSSMRPPVLVLDGLGASQNVGQVLRTAYHLGVTTVLVSRSVWNSLGGRACRVSMGWPAELTGFVHETVRLPCL